MRTVARSARLLLLSDFRATIHDARVELIELRFHFRPIQITNGCYKLEVYIPSIKKLLEYPALSLRSGRRLFSKPVG